MGVERRHVCLGFTDERYPEGTHICYLYSDDGERRRILSLFARQALLEGERLDYLADVSSSADFSRVMADLSLPRPAAGLPGHIEIATTREAYFPDGAFDPDLTLALARQHYQDAIAAGHNGARSTGEMGWALRGIPGSERLVEFESRINQLVQDTPVTVMCQYDLREFDGATMFDIMSVHPVMVVGGHILRNPFYQQPAAGHGHRTRP